MKSRPGDENVNIQNACMIADMNQDSAVSKRRANKPLMERKRRARINSSLTELKALVLEGMKKDPNRYARLEKADILEMTVNHMKTLQKQHTEASVKHDPDTLLRYKSGFVECTTEITRYLSKMEGIETDLKANITSHLSQCLNKISSSIANVQTIKQVSPNPMMSPGGDGDLTPGGDRVNLISPGRSESDIYTDNSDNSSPSGSSDKEVAHELSDTSSPTSSTSSDEYRARRKMVYGDFQLLMNGQVEGQIMQVKDQTIQAKGQTIQAVSESLMAAAMKRQGHSQNENSNNNQKPLQVHQSVIVSAQQISHTPPKCTNNIDQHDQHQQRSPHVHSPHPVPVQDGLQISSDMWRPW